MEQLIRGMEVSPERSKALRKLHLLNTKLSASRPGGGNLRVEAEYYEKLVERISRG